MKNRPRLSLPLLSIAAAFFVSAAPDLRAQITVGSNGPDETDANDYSGAQTLTKIGSNTVSLTGTSTYSDTTTVSAGTLSLGNGGTTGSISGTANVVVNSLLQFNRSDAIEFDKVISGTGGFLKSGANTVTLTADNSFSGASLVETGTLQIGNGGTTGSLGTGTITNNGTLIFNRDGLLTNSGTIRGTGSLTKTGAGTVVLTGISANRGLTTVAQGALEVLAGRVASPDVGGAYLVTNNGKLMMGFNNAFDRMGIKVYGNGTNATTGLSFRGGTLWRAEGPIELLGAPTTIRSYDTNRGLVGLGNFNLFGNIGVNVSSDASGSVIDAGIQMVNLGYGSTVTVAVGSNNATGDLIIEGRLNVAPRPDGGAGFYKAGNGSVRIMSPGTATNNWVGIGAGVLIAGTNGVLGDNAQLDVSAPGTLKMNGYDQTARMLTGSGRIVNGSATAAVFTINQTNRHTNQNPNTTFSGVIGGTNANEQNLSMVKNGSGTLTLSGNNNYSGTTFIGSGPLQIGAGGASGSLGTGNVTNNGSLIINRNNDYALSNNISGTGSFQQAGTGRTILSGTTTYDGTTTVGAGTLQFSKVSSFYNGNTADWTEANIIVRSNATLGLSVGGAGEFTQGNIDTILANLDGSVTTGGLLAGSTIAFATDNTPGGNFVLTNSILDTTGPAGGSVGLGKLGAGTMVLTSDQGYSGTTTIHAGTLSLGNGGATGSISNTANVVANGTLQFNRSDAIEFDRTISGTGGILKSGANTVTLTADNSFSGSSLIDAGTLQVGNGGTTGSIGTSSITNNGSLIFNRDGVLTNSGTIFGAGSLTKTGAGKVVLMGNSYYTGLTTVNQGTLEVLGSRSISGNIITGAYVVTNNATLMIGFENQRNNPGGWINIKVYGDGTNATTGLYFRGGVQWNATGKIELLDGPTTIRSYETNRGLVGIGSWAYDGLTVSSNASGSATDAGIEFINRGYGAIVNVAAGSNNASGDLTIQGRLNVGGPGFLGVGQFVKQGDGSIRIMSAGTTTNNWVVIQQGLVIAGTAGVLGDHAQLDVASGGTFKLNGFDQTARMLGGSGRIINDSATEATLIVNQTNKFSYENPNTTFSGVIGGTNADEQNLSLVKNGFGTLTLSGNNNYSGSTFIGSGPLQIGAGGASGSLGAGAVTNNGSLIINRNNEYALSNNVSGTGSFEQAGTGRTILNGTNTYDGTTTVGAGTLQFASLSSLYNGATAEWTKENITVRSNAAVIFNVGGAGEFTQPQINTLMTNLGGAVNNNGLLGGSSLGFDTANDPDGNFIISNAIADTTGTGGGSIGLAKYGANTLTLAVDNGYTGGTTIYAGTLAVGTGGTTGSISGDVDNRGTLLFNRADNSTFTGEVSGTGSLVNAGAGTTTLTGSNTYTGTTTISAGGLTIAGSGVLGGGNYTANITNIGSFSYNSSANQTLRGTFSGDGAINKDGTGSLTLASIPNYGGSTLNISNGTTLITGGRFGGNIGLAAINVVGSGAVLQTTTHALGGYGQPTPAIAITNGTWNLRNEQYVNSLTLNQATVTGPGEVRSDSAFSVLVTNGTSTWSAPLNLVVTDASFNVVSGATLQMSNRIFGGLGLVKNGEGTIVLNATNTTYSGYTTISNGVLRAGANDVMSSNSIVRVQGGAFDPNGTTNTLRGLVLYNVTNGLKAGEKITTTVNSDESFQLGSAAGNVTEYNMTGGEFVVATGHLQNGYYGKSTLNQSGGTLSVDQGFFVLGRMAGGEGIYNLTGGTAVQSNAGTTMIIGELGRGEMNVSGTGTLTAAGTIRIGIGSASSGALNIFDGGTVSAPRIEFGSGTNNSVNFDRSDSLSFTSPITGAGYVTKTGTGTVTFTQNNSYTRGTTVNGGTLVAQALANNSNNTITVNSGGTFVFNRTDTFGSHGATVLTPIVINDGGVVRSGSSNIFNALGSVTLNGGTLESIGGITNWSWNDTPRDFALKGDVTVGGSNTSTIAGPGVLLGSAAVTGTTFNVSNGAAPVDLRVTAGLADGPTPGWWYAQPSYLTKVGSGNMQLEGTNIYTGNTTVGAGTLTVAGAGQLGSGNYNGDMVISNGATFVQASSANQTLGGVISGGGNLVKSSTGTLTLDGLENTYTGTTTIDGGKLLLNVNHTGAGAYTVNNGGTLGGIGATTADVTVNSGGTIAPGNSPGQLTVGNFTLNTGGTLNIFLSGGVSSLLQVNGNVNLAGGGVDFTTLTTPLTASLYTFVQYTGSLAGTFGFTNNLPTGYELVYGDDQTIFLAQSNVAYPVAPVFKGTNAVITGGTLPFEVAVLNNDVTNIVFWATNGSNTTGGFGDTPLAVDDSTNVAGLTWNGTNVGANQAGNFAVTFSNGSGTNQVTNVAVTVSVYDHAAGSLVTNAITNLDAIVGYTGPLTASILATNAGGFRAPLGTTSTSTNGNLVVTDVSDVDPENSDNLLFALTGQGAGAFSNDVTVVFRDSSTLSGASTNLGSTNVTVTGTIYNHAQGSISATNLGFAPVHAGYAGPLTTTNSITVSNAAGLNVDLGVANNNTDAFIDLAAVTGLTNGTSTNLSATMDAGRGVGAFSNIVTLTFYDDSTLLGASTSLSTTNIVITGLVYSGQGVWTAPAGGNWTNFSNWTADGGVPGIDGPLSVNDTAFFGTNGSGPVTLDTTVALLSVTFSNTNSYNMSGSGTLTLAASGPADPSITSRAGTHTISNAVAATGNLLLDTTNNAGLVLNGVISGVASLVKDGAGTAFLGAANTYSGTTTVAAGTLVGTVAGSFSTNTIIVGADDTNNAALLVDVSNGGFKVSNAITVAPNPGTTTIGSLALGTNGWAEFTGPIELQESVILVSAPGLDASNNRTDFSGGITGTGNVTISTATNSRVVFLGNENTFAGNVAITPGSTLQLGDGSPTGTSFIPDASSVDVGSNAFLKLAKGNNNEWIAGLTGTGTVEAIVGTNELVIGHTGVSSTFAGTLRDNGGVLDIVKIGQGTQTLTGTNTYSGKTDVNTGTLSVVGPGKIDGTRQVWVFNTGNSIDVLDGGVVSSTGNVLIGYNSTDADNQINVRGVASALSAAGTVEVGYQGTNNQLNVSEGTVTAGRLWVGSQTAAVSNSVTLNDKAILNVTNQLVVGYGGSGNTMEVLGGSKVTATGTNNVEVGKDAGANGNSLIVSGLGSQLTATNGFLLGRAGASNSLLVEDGAKLVTGQARIGSDATADGNTATIDGGGAGGASWDVTGTLRVGLSGDNNTLNVTNGGVVTATGNVWVGYLGTTNSNNLINISGLNSRLQTAADLVIGPNAGASNRVVVAHGGGIVANAITIHNGKLQIGNGGDAGLVQTPLITGSGVGMGVVEFNHTNAPYNFDPTISSTISVVHSGSGTTVIAASNSYTGGTTVTAGRLVAQSQTALGTGSVDLFGGTLELQSQLDIGSLFWNGAATIAIANPGAGHFVNLGTNNLTLTNGINNFDLTGFTLTTTPTALMSSANMASFNTNAFGALGVTNYTLLVSNSTLYISLIGPLDLIATTAGTFVATPTNSYASVVYEPTGQLTIDPGAGATITNPVVMSNNSITTVNGTFTAPSFTVQSGSTLGGAGTINGNVTNSGTFAPSGATSLTLNGNLTFTSGGSYLWSLYDNTTNGPGSNFTAPLALNGAFTVDPGSIFNVDLAGLVSATNTFWAPGVTNTWTVMTSPGGFDASSNFALALSGLTNGFTATEFSLENLGTSLVLKYVKSFADLIATTVGTFVTTPTNTYANVVYEPVGKLTISNGAGVTINNPVVMSNNSTTTVNGTFTAPSFTVQSGSTLGGAGTINGNVTNSGIFAPSGSTSLTLNGNLTFASGGSYLWSLFDNTTSGPGTNFTAPLALNGSLTVDPGSIFNVDLAGLVAATNTFWGPGVTNTWTVMTGPGSFGASSNFGLALSGLTNGFSASEFSLENLGTSLVLKYIKPFADLIATTVGTFVTTPTNTYANVVYEPTGKLTISNGAGVTINNPVVMSNNSTTTVNGTFTAPSFTVQSGSTLGGAGTINGNVTNSGIFAPSGSTSLTLNGNLTFASGGSYLWSLFDNTTSGPGTNFTAPSALNGSLTVDPGSIFNIDLAGLVSATNNFWARGVTNTWTVMTGPGGFGAASNFTLALSGLTNGFKASSFSLATNAGGLVLSYYLDPFVWATNNTGPWNTGTNWLAGTAPMADDDAFIANGGTAVIDGAGVTGEGKTVTIGETDAGTVNVNNGGTLSAANVVIAAQAGSTGTLNIGTPGGNDSAGIIDTAAIGFGAGNGTINFNQVNATTLAATLSGTGSVKQAGAGTSTLSGSNSYAGTTTVEKGTLIAANGSALGGSAVTLNTTNTGANNASLLLAVSNAPLTLSNPITVAGLGTGVTTLGSSQLGTNGWATFAGPISLGKDVTLVAAPGQDAVNNRTDFRGGISGTGDVTISTATNSRVVFMAEANTFDGDVIINPNSVLQLSDGTPNNKELIPIGSKVDIGAGASLKLAKGGNSETIAGLSGTGTVEAIAGADRLIIDAMLDSVFSGTMKDGPGAGNTLAMTKKGSGAMTVGGNNSYSGGTTLEAGKLVTTSQTALGTGTVQLLGGTLELQSQLDIGSLFWNSASKISIPNPAAGHFVNAGGTLTLEGGPNTFDLTGATKLKGKTTLLAAPNISGSSFSPTQFEVEGVDNTRYAIKIVDGAIVLVRVPGPRPPTPAPKPAYPDFTQFAGNPNQMQVAKALNQWAASNPSGDRAAVLDAIVGSGDYQNAFNQLMPTMYESIGTTAFNLANVLNTSLFERLWLVRINGEGFSARGLAPAPLQGETGGGDDFIVKPPKNWGVFVDGYGVFANASGAQTLENYNFQSGGVTGGASYKWNDNFSTGVYVGYQGLQAQYDNGGRLVDNAVRFGGFGTLLIDNFFFNTIVGGAYHNYQVDRSIEFGSIDRTASGDPSAGEFDFALGGGYDFKVGNFVFGPTTSLQYTYLNVQGFEERGADSLNLKVDGYDTSSLLYSLGGQVAYNWKLSQKVVITPRLTAGWQHEFLQNAYPINAAFATGGPVTPFSYQTTSPIRDYFYGGASVAVGIDDTWETAFFYNAIANQDLVSHSIYFSIGAKF